MTSDLCSIRLKQFQPNCYHRVSSSRSSHRISIIHPKYTEVYFHEFIFIDKEINVTPEQFRNRSENSRLALKSSQYIFSTKSFKIYDMAVLLCHKHSNTKCFTTNKNTLLSQRIWLYFYSHVSANLKKKSHLMSFRQTKNSICYRYSMECEMRSNTQTLCCVVYCVGYRSSRMPELQIENTIKLSVKIWYYKVVQSRFTGYSYGIRLCLVH